MFYKTYLEITNNQYYVLIANVIDIIHCKNSFDINSDYPSLERSQYTVANKDDLDSFIKTKTSILAFKAV